MDLQELNNLGPGFLVVEEPDYSRERLLEFQRKFGVNTIVLFEHLDNFGTIPGIEISEKELAIWKHYFNIFIMAEGDPWDLLEYDEETLWGKALEEGDTSPPPLFPLTLYVMFQTEKWCSTWACK
ncbi:hypothetical protein [Desulfofundulus thermosubterraneus]|uniref:Uncharacterized protein n=1 Tax=Desulfofundulus thermosubterraneus DSM 16057 TaxID=1121432 RepID=A0A1M6MSB7_9FIRM|nr:hypothetical protein [Desulfofundulus thermosubterraneus]SHJ86398.1 hypothetical protein SAMN02745219_03517 [Desulfofundulus thermosubterraneus DSM 16057]